MVLRKPGFRYRPFACALWTGLLAALPAAAAQGGLADLAARYRSADAQLQKHVVDDQWLDAKPDSPQLLAKRWDLAGEWMAAWRDGHPQAAAKEACAAFAAVVGKGASCGALTIMEVGTTPENARDCATLPPPPAGEGWGGGKSHRETQPPSQPSPASGGRGKGDLCREGGAVFRSNALLVATPGPFGNVFIVAGDGASHRVAWNIARQPAVPGPMGPIIAAWQAGNAREQAATERSGPIAGPVGVLPADAQGRSRFYIDGIRAQAAGATVGAQTTVWVWDGKAAQPLLAHAYGMMLDQSVGTRFEQGLLKLREKRDYRAFFSCGACEGRQVDWSVRVDAKGVSEQGVRSVAPELDVLDELLWRRIHGRAANDIAAPAAVAQVDALVRKAKAEVSAADWKQFPSFGMANALDVRKSASGARACVDTDAAGAFTADLQRRGEGWFITRIAVAPKGCSASGA